MESSVLESTLAHGRSGFVRKNSLTEKVWQRVLSSLIYGEL